MKHRTPLWTTLAAAALLAWPLGSAAQSTSSTQSGQAGAAQGEQEAGASVQTPPSTRSPAFYLEQARRDLDALSSTVRTSDAGKDLEQHFTALRDAYQRDAGTSAGSGATSGTSGTSGSTATAGTDIAHSAVTWRTHYEQIEQILDGLNIPKSTAWTPSPGSGSGSGSASAGSGTSGAASGTSGSTSGSTATAGTASESARTYASIPLDASDVAQLRQFRHDIEMFHQVVSAQERQRR